MRPALQEERVDRDVSGPRDEEAQADRILRPARQPGAETPALLREGAR
jgi:hypothetical protein